MRTSCSGLFLAPVGSCNKSEAHLDDTGLPYMSKTITQAALDVQG